MNEILITSPIPGHPDLERLNLFAGRHMGEEEFDRQQAYSDRRLAPLLIHRNPGIVHGLHVRTGQFASAEEGFTINPGLALAANGQSLGLYYSLRQNWSTVIENYLSETGAASAAGVFYLTLRRTSRYVDADPDVDPCQRTEFDPTRDARRLVVGTVGMTRLAVDATMIATASRERIENWVAANNVGGEFLAGMDTAVPLGLLAVEQSGTDTEGDPVYSVSWFSEAAGRYHAVADSGYHVLLQQVNSAFRRALLATESTVDETTTIQDYLNTNLQLDFLPAAGELPRELILNIASTSPGVTWLPGHLGVDMVPVPEESVNEIVERHLPRRVVDLRQPAGDRLRLLLAVNEPDYKPTLLDYPQTDAQLQQDIYRYFMRAHNVWAHWLRQFNKLYFLTEEDVLDAGQLDALSLPKPVAIPQRPEDFFAQIITESESEVGTSESDEPLYPYNQGVPPYPDFYRSWGVEDQSQPGNPVLPPVVEDPEEDGLVIRFAMAQVELEALDNEIRDVRGRLEKTRDYLLLQRQQLDNQTVSMASLAGGVAGDGSGLQVARWLPFAKLRANEIEEPTEEEPEETQPTTAKTTISPYALNLTPTYSTFASKSITETATALSSRTQPKISLATKNNLVFSSALRKTPTVHSALQFNLNNLRLDKLSNVTKQALTKPSFETKEYRFGVIEHIRPELQEYKKALRGMRELRSTLDGLFHVGEAKSIKSVFDKMETNPDGTKKIPPLEQLGINTDGTTASGTNAQQLAPRLYEALFTAGQVLTEQISYMEGRYARVEALLEGKLRSRLRKEGLIEKLAALIEQATQELENLDKRRIEYLGDYGVAQRLLDDDWLQIYKENQERTRILTTGVKGVYYVRERQTPVSLPLADPLALRYGKAGDIVPGCDWEDDPELPEELEDFFDTVLEVPMDDWRALKDLRVYIPPPTRLHYVAALRHTRLQRKTQRYQNATYATRPLTTALFAVRSQSQSVLTQLARFELPLQVAAARQRQHAAAKTLSLEDILSGTRGHLQRQGQVLHNRLEQAVACLLEKLGEVAPSVRLQWQQLAEDDRLRVEDVAYWPGLERAERDDFNATRTVAELIQWWFRQVADNASAEARAATRNMIRATVIHSALGDPTEIIQGQVHVPPRRLALGEPLRLKLNRRAKPGTVLQLMDPQQRTVAMLNVEDDDDKGTTAQVTLVTEHSAIVNTQFKVVASKMTRLLR